MTNTADTELKKFDSTSYIAPDGSIYVREGGNYDNYHGFVNKHSVGDSVGDLKPGSKDLIEIKVKIFQYNSFFDMRTILSCLLLQHKLALALTLALFLFINSHYYTKCLKFSLLSPLFKL